MLTVSSGALARFSENRIESARSLITKYGAIELIMENMIQLEDFAKLTELHKGVKSVHVPLELCHYTNAAHIKAIVRAIELSEMMGAANFVLHLSDKVKPEESVQLIEPILKRNWKVRIAVENGHKDPFMCFEPFLGLIKKYNLHVCFDMAHALLNDVSFFEHFKEFKDNVVQLHVSDLNETGMHAALCRGQRDWQSLFHKLGYRGYAVLEYGLHRWKTLPTGSELFNFIDTDLAMLRKLGF